MMIAFGVDFHAASPATRGHWHRTGTMLDAFYARARHMGARELFVLQTCNRIEWYACMEPSTTPHLVFDALVHQWAGDDIAARQLWSAAVVREGDAVARHLVRVTVGLESRIVGDAEILGQVRRAVEHADTAGTLGPRLRRILDGAVHAARRVRHETGLVRPSTSSGAVAVREAERHVGSLTNRRCLVIGAGKLGGQIAYRLARHGPAALMIANRCPGRARALAEAVRAVVVPFTGLDAAVAQADVVFVATGAASPVIRRDALAEARESGNSSLLLLDLAVPPNVAPDVATLRGVTRVALDDVAAVLPPSPNDILHAERIVEDVLAKRVSVTVGEAA